MITPINNHQGKLKPFYSCQLTINGKMTIPHLGRLRLSCRSKPVGLRNTIHEFENAHWKISLNNSRPTKDPASMLQRYSSFSSDLCANSKVIVPPHEDSSFLVKAVHNKRAVLWLHCDYSLKSLKWHHIPSIWLSDEPLVWAVGVVSSAACPRMLDFLRFLGKWLHYFQVQSSQSNWTRIAS